MGNVYFIQKRFYVEPARLSTDEVVESKNYFDHGSGQLEDLDTRIQNLERTLGQLIGVLVDKKSLGNEEIQAILGKDYSIEGIEDDD